MHDDKQCMLLDMPHFWMIRKFRDIEIWRIEKLLNLMHGRSLHLQAKCARRHRQLALQMLHVSVLNAYAGHPATLFAVLLCREFLSTCWTFNSELISGIFSESLRDNSSGGFFWFSNIFQLSISSRGLPLFSSSLFSVVLRFVSISFFFWTRNGGPRTGSRQKQHSTAVRKTVIRYTIMTTDRSTTCNPLLSNRLHQENNQIIPRL